MEYRRAISKDINAFVQNRIEFVTSIREITDVESFKRNTKEYITANIDSDKLIIYIAVDGDAIISSCMACIFETAPLPSCLNGKSAELLNVYTKEMYRHKGHSRKLLELIIKEIKENGVEKIFLESTKDGFGLYEKIGFSLLENQMQLKLK